MAQIRAFRGYRYDLGRVGALSDVVAPPYDVIGSEQQQALHDRSEYNSVHLELSRSRPGDTERDNRYTRAAQTLRDWLADDILVRDSARCLYACEQEFEAEGVRHRRRGFFAQVKLEPFGTGQVYPHEETMSGPKRDRLELYRATHMNVSPIFGLYPDPENAAFAPLEGLLHRKPPLVAEDDTGVTHRLWPVTEIDAISRVVELIGDKPVYIADGHHRYETGLNYRDELAAGGTLPDDHPANFTLMMLVGMSDPGMIILPTHRTLTGQDVPSARWRQVLEGHFEVEEVGDGPDAGRAAWESVLADGSQRALALGGSDGRWLLARLTRPGVMAELAPDRSGAWRGLAVSVLHSLILGRLFDGALSFGYSRLLDGVIGTLHDGRCQAAVLVPPPTMDDVRAVSGHGEKMPPKSTYFYPKLATGLVFNSLKSN